MGRLCTERHNQGARAFLRAYQLGNHGCHLTIANVGNDRPTRGQTPIRHEQTVPSWILPCSCSNRQTHPCSCPARLCPDFLICHGLPAVPSASGRVPNPSIYIQIVEFCFSLEAGDPVSLNAALLRKRTKYIPLLQALLQRGWGIYGMTGSILPDITVLTVGTCCAIPCATLDALSHECGIPESAAAGLAAKWVSIATNSATSLLATHARLSRESATTA